MKDYVTNRIWSDQFLPEVKRQIGAHLLKVAPDELDQKQATDLLMLDARDTRVAVRIRRPGYHSRYPDQFTIRSKVASGAQTELSKVVNGHGDWMFYGHASADGRTLEQWQLLDLRGLPGRPHTPCSERLPHCAWRSAKPRWVSVQVVRCKIVSKRAAVGRGQWIGSRKAWVRLLSHYWKGYLSCAA